MTWTLSQSGTKTPTVSGTVTYTGASALGTFTNTFAAGDSVFFSGTTAPTLLTFFTKYYVIATGLTGSVFEVSATLGGSAISPTTTGTAVVANPIQNLGTPDTNNGTFVLEVDTSAMLLGDLLSIYLFGISLSGGVTQQKWKGTYQHVQVNAQKISPPITSDISITAAILQRAGTARAYPWKLLRI